MSSSLLSTAAAESTKDFLPSLIELIFIIVGLVGRCFIVVEEKNYRRIGQGNDDLDFKGLISNSKQAADKFMAQLRSSCNKN
jgi:hypothetical protein